MSLALANTRVTERSAIYEGFVGLDTSRDISAQDTGEQQVLAHCNNAYCDGYGQIVRMASAKRVGGEGAIQTVSMYAIGRWTYAEHSASGIDLVSSEGPRLVGAYPEGTHDINSVVYNNKAVYVAAGHSSYVYDGDVWTTLNSEYLDSVQPGFVTVVGSRVAVAGGRQNPTVVEMSRVNDEQVFRGDDISPIEDVQRAGFIDIANVLKTGDRITGLATFEQSRLVIFTNDRALVYRTPAEQSPDTWGLDEQANVYIGAVSHAAITYAGNDVLFCSRNGIHSLRRSVENGIQITSNTLSRRILLLYREFIRSTVSLQDISAVWDQDDSQLHVFFPRADGSTRRLVMTYDAQTQQFATFATSDYLNACFGATLAGQFLVATPSGIYEIGHVEETEGEAVSMDVWTPLLWHGAMELQKNTRSLVLQAAGKARIRIEAYDEFGQLIFEDEVQVEPTDEALVDDRVPDKPLLHQYSRRFERHYRGVQFRLTSTGTGLLRISGLAVTVRRDPDLRRDRPRRAA